MFVGDISLTVEPEYPNDGDQVTLTCIATMRPTQEVDGAHHSSKECSVWWTRTSYPARTVSREPVVDTSNTMIETVTDKSTSPVQHRSVLTIKVIEEALEGQYTCSYWCPASLEAANVQLKTYGKTI